MHAVLAAYMPMWIVRQGIRAVYYIVANRNNFNTNLCLQYVEKISPRMDDLDLFVILKRALEY